MCVHISTKVFKNIKERNNKISRVYIYAIVLAV